MMEVPKPRPGQRESTLTEIAEMHRTISMLRYVFVFEFIFGLAIFALLWTQVHNVNDFLQQQQTVNIAQQRVFNSYLRAFTIEQNYICSHILNAGPPNICHVPVPLPPGNAQPTSSP